MQISGWDETPNTLEKEFVFGSFEMAMEFIRQAAIRITEINHHPEWSNVYNRVHVKLTTHDAGNVVTQKDRELAEILDEIYEKVAPTGIEPISSV
jgi:4a-hydroxytetrahydrobiopterin dehydratase